MKATGGQGTRVQRRTAGTEQSGQEREDMTALFLPASVNWYHFLQAMATETIIKSLSVLHPVWGRKVFSNKPVLASGCDLSLLAGATEYTVAIFYYTDDAFCTSTAADFCFLLCNKVLLLTCATHFCNFLLASNFCYLELLLLLATTILMLERLLQHR